MGARALVVGMNACQLVFFFAYQTTEVSLHCLDTAVSLMLGHRVLNTQEAPAGRASSTLATAC